MNSKIVLQVISVSVLLIAGCGSDDDILTPTESIDVSSPDTTAISDTATNDSSTTDSTTPRTTCPPGDGCDDGNPCTENGVCNVDGQTCEAALVTCDDLLDCTDDACDPAVGCTHTLKPLFCISGTPAACLAVGDPAPETPCQLCGPDGDLVPLANDVPCEDKDVCTKQSTCVAGYCIPSEVTICEDDDNPCTTDDCDPVQGCAFPANSEPCDDGDPCTVADQCAGGVCSPGAALDCDDNDTCTNDSCITDTGCFYEATNICVDDDPCTDDVCTNGNCSNVPFEGPCEDGDPCTSGEACVAGICSGGEPTICDDSNTCTTDVCEDGIGCVYYYDDGALCSDGFWCTYNDECAVGQCLGTKYQCPDCPTPTTGLAVKIVELLVSSDGKAGSGLDVDEDPTTCAPADNCSGGVDNALGVLAALLNPGLQETIESGTVLYVADFSALDTTGQPFPFSVLETDLTEAAEAASCDFQSTECDYEASQYSYGPSCTAYFGLPNATWNTGTFEAGGIGHIMTIALRLSGNTFIPITLVNAKVEGQVILDEATGNINGAVGIFAGATPKQQLVESITSLNFDTLPIDKDTALSLLELLVVNDVDLDGNGEADGASIAIRFVGIPANLE